MDKELKTEWIKRLESGKYSQGTEKLRGVDEDDQDQETGDASFCCLGVLCDIFMDRGLGEWNGQVFEPDYSVFGSRAPYEYHGLEGELNDVVLAYVGMTNEQQQHLVGMNDNDGYNFDEIAEYIDENL